ncbi:hypothetical protein EON82_15200 [bacterium]|nr:MAG: hypothetical protein EON82_15200 [bacterium]
MMKKLLLLVPIAIVAAGCSGGDDRGDVAKAQASPPPKSTDQLPADMPPQARASASNAMRANDAMVAQQKAQMDAMVKATQGAR